MIVGVIADFMAGGSNGLNEMGIVPGMPAHHEKCGLSFVLGQHL